MLKSQLQDCIDLCQPIDSELCIQDWKVLYVLFNRVDIKALHHDFPADQFTALYHQRHYNPT